ncbi:MAG TPA: Crp/Fnr family transcriptional regulator [Acidobacteriaceae bacterium]|jgi:CRP-like cAMP-binding protein|nr:Crp/Fnr family transcriptional regulator [Acidobacteriaceae bacterium]
MSLDLSELVSELNRIASDVSMNPDAVLFRSGDPVSGVFIVRKGAIRLSLGVPNDLYPPRILGPGEIVGLPATLTGHYSLTAEVAEFPAELGFVPSRRVSELLEYSPRLCFLAMRLISEEITRVRTALKETPPLQAPSEPETGIR